MNRNISQRLQAWKEKADRKPLIVNGARQVGKTYSLKYFCENAPQYHVAVAGSLLGISLHAGSSFPVGKVDMVKIYRNAPMRLSTHQNNLYSFERIGGNAETDSIPVQTSWKQSKHFTKHLSLKLAI